MIGFTQKNLFFTITPETRSCPALSVAIKPVPEFQ